MFCYQQDPGHKQMRQACLLTGFPTHETLARWSPPQVFCYQEDPAHKEMRQACFDYLRLGGIYSAGPVSLLSGLNPRPSVLVMHFFMVALFGCGRLLLPRPTLW